MKKRKSDGRFPLIRMIHVIGIADEKKYSRQYSKKSAPSCNDCSATVVTEQVPRIRKAQGRNCYPSWFRRRHLFIRIKNPEVIYRN